MGSEAGRLDRYNMQSGMHRGSYCRDPKAMQEAIRKSGPGVPAPKALLDSPGLTAHDGPVTGICTGVPAAPACCLPYVTPVPVPGPAQALSPSSPPPPTHSPPAVCRCPPADSCNRLAATAGRDGFIRIWDFKKRALKAEIRVGCPVTRVCHHAGTGLMAAACEDNVIRMYDMEVGCTACTAALGLCCLALHCCLHSHMHTCTHPRHTAQRACAPAAPDDKTGTSPSRRTLIPAAPEDTNLLHTPRH